MIDVVKWAESKQGFYVDRSWRDGGWVLEAGPINLAGYHARILRHVFSPDASGRLPYDVIAWAEPAKSGKTAIAALCAQHMALHGDRNSSIILASNKRDQAASLMFKSLSDSVNMNPFLPNVSPNRTEVGFRSGNQVVAIASNSRGAAGARFSLALFDELAGFIHQDAQRLWSEFKTDPTRLNSLKMALGFAGYAGESTLWEDLLNLGLKGEPVPELADLDDGRGEPACWANGRTFVFWSHQCRQPWQTEAWIESQRASLRPAEFSRMIETDFSEGSGDFIEQVAWEELVDPDLQPLPGGTTTPVFLGLDLASKAFGDDCALIGVYAQDGKVKVAFHRIWKGGRARRSELRLSETVLPHIRGLRRDYQIQGVYFDPFQALLLAEQLRAEGLWCIEIPQTHGSRGPRDTALHQMAITGELRLYDHPDLRRMASNARAKELGNGMIFLSKAGGKIDLLIALANVASEARSQLDRPDGRAVAEMQAALTQPSRWTTAPAGSRWGRVRFERRRMR